MTIRKLGLFFLLRTTLTFCQVIILLYTMSQAHKVIYASLKSISGQHSESASFHMVIENVTDIFFPKWALLEQCACIDLILMQLNCILQHLNRGTPLDRIWRAQIRAPNTKFYHISHFWPYFAYLGAYLSVPSMVSVSLLLGAIVLIGMKYEL